MKSRKKQIAICSILPILSLLLCSPLASYGQDMSQTTPPATTVVPTVIATASLDTISIKQREMLYTNVKVGTNRGSGSGTIIDCIESEENELFEIRVLTNEHVTRGRRETRIVRVDAITGRVTRQTIDTGCLITVFNHTDETKKVYESRIVKEEAFLDLAILSFLSEDKLPIAKIASGELLSSVRVFSEVFAIGCQLGRFPIPTSGMISRIITHGDGDNERTTYMHTAQLIGGSSGGGLFMEHDGHYYLIGVPFRVHNDWRQVFPHLGESIAVSVAQPLINESSVSE